MSQSFPQRDEGRCSSLGGQLEDKLPMEFALNFRELQMDIRRTVLARRAAGEVRSAVDAEAVLDRQQEFFRA
jgi:hypothetical protein